MSETTAVEIARPGASDWDTRFEEALTRVATAASGHDADGSFPHGSIDELRALGLVALTAPTAADGGGHGLTTAAAILQRVGSADPSVGLVLLWQFLFQAEVGANPERWPAGPRERVQRSAVEDGALLNALRVEPELGTPARGGIPATTAVRSADGRSIRLRGHKIYCTGIPALRWLLVWAATDDDVPEVGAFLVEAGTPGYRVEETWNSMGLRASGTHDVILDDVVIPAEHALDVRTPEAWRTEDRRVQLAWAGVLMAANYTGIAVAARDWLVRYLNERTPSNLGAPLATLPHFQQAVGEVEALLQVSATLIRDVAAGVDAAECDAVERGPLVKHVATANAIQATEIALRLTGNPGLSREHPLERHYRDALTGRVHTPQADTVLGALGRAALGRGGGVRVLG
jgi:alkylation response protein AidB-like acyl-CoA dehydrogenase